MRVLIYEWKNFGIDDVVSALDELGHTCRVVSDETINDRVSAEFDSRFEDIVADGFDCVFSFNYCAIISNNCQRLNIPYIAYVYDSPLVQLYSYTLINSCNHVFLFDSRQYLEFKNAGINTVYYAPLSANPDRIEAQLSAARSSGDISRFAGDISFVGSMYNEKHNLFDRLKSLPPYVSGYLDSIMQAQLKVYGFYFLEDMLTDDIIAELKKSVPLNTNRDGVETIQYMYANYFLARKMASIERKEILGRLSKDFNVNLYTPNPTPDMPHIKNHGPIDYYDDMPSVFAASRINLNISLRSIANGIPLRCIDIMAAGGFLLSNYQQDFYDTFVPGEDCVLYESLDDCAAKCRYYLSHESERAQIAANGLGKIKDGHTYKIRLSQMFDIVFN